MCEYTLMHAVYGVVCEYTLMHAVVWCGVYVCVCAQLSGLCTVDLQIEYAYSSSDVDRHDFLDET